MARAPKASAFCFLLRTENRELRTALETQGPVPRTQPASGPSPAHSRNSKRQNPLPARTNHQTPRRNLRTSLRPGRRRQGFGISRPYGDSERYDIILDWSHISPVIPNRAEDAARNLLYSSIRPRLVRVQVKSSTQLQYGLYRVNAHRRINGRAVPYTLAEIDFFAAYVIPEDSWFIFPLTHILGATAVTLSPKRRRKPHINDPYREAWHLLREPDGLEFA